MMRKNDHAPSVLIQVSVIMFMCSHARITGSCSTVGNLSDYRCPSDCRPRSREFDLDWVLYFVEVDYKVISIVILLPSPDSFKKGFGYKRKYVHKLMVNRLFKLAQEKVWFGELTIPHDHSC